MDLRSSATPVPDGPKLGRSPTNKGQIFFGCPHRCSSTQELEDNVARLFLANGIACLRGITNTIRDLGKSIIQINEAFLAFKIPLTTGILSVYCKKQETSSGVSCSLESERLLSKHYL